ncbi:hypothetical protein N7539_006584 [Penicillium diatomitis]|uniref:Diphthine--ammonia ligase n=1 Tax=Penicillium diatomitis TaxID=2819901 RepID=A0A9W9X1I6_9EURO|nr:uncharacterized protein N7539_006584 [Penicillium diatomitis]KAJ5480690.1 hypothetical protein N7539_006584 [Penicillium diatomitis]
MSSSAATAPPTPGLNVIALISGGKDSLYSILHCIRNGHKVVALANLHPALRSKPTCAEPGDHATPDEIGNDDNDPVKAEDEEEEEDIDSFMYQTVGHSIIPLYETALGIPLYRAPIKGGALDTARVYRHDAADQAAETITPSKTHTGSVPDQIEDETESLVPLLRRIMQAHPEANAVSAGAILSTYQRTRIENVAGRLGLVPLAWLWMYPSLPAPVERDADPAAVAQVGLLEDMAACGCDARIIKVASGGLDDGFLWENVSGASGVRRRLVKSMSRFAAPEDIRGAVLGEGGEYETLAIDGPGFLWKKRIEVESRDVGTGEGGVAYSKLTRAKCVSKSEDGKEDRPEDVRKPALLDISFAAVLREMSSNFVDSSPSPFPSQVLSPSLWSLGDENHRVGSSTWTISNINAPEAGPGALEQMEGIVTKIQQALLFPPDSIAVPRSTDDIVFATVLLHSMADFAMMNQVYVSIFKKPNPPARVTVACGDRLPADTKVSVSIVVDLGPRHLRQGLHVQSRSYWAPANIGPYSQAISIPFRDEGNTVFIAGQIPLEPASMEIFARDKHLVDGYLLRATLALQHLWRIGEAMQVNWWLGAVVFMTGGEHIEAQARIAWQLWKSTHSKSDENLEDENEGEGPQLDAWDIKYGGRAGELTPEVIARNLPDFSVVEDDSDTTVPPFLAVEVHELPRGSDIEWQGLGIRCRQVLMQESEDGVASTIDRRYRYRCVGIGSEKGDESCFERLRSLVTSYCRRPNTTQAVLYSTFPVPDDLWPSQIVPCRSVWGPEGQRLVASLVLQEELF